MDDENHKWDHYFWTNNKKAIPLTVKWFEEHGFIVKELKELSREVYDELVESVVDSYADERFGAAADISRFAILNDQGGFYMDMDFAPVIWDNEILYYFDSIHWRESLCGCPGYD
jgi:mannosyltransferase OCH1-like enzyme